MRVIVRVSAGGTLQLAQHIATAAGVLALGYCLAVLLDAKLYEAREARTFARELCLKEGKKAPLDSVAPVTKPDRAPATRSDRDGIVGRLDIPRIGVSVMIVEGAGGGDLRRAVGHIPGTALPWESGNVGIAGHRDTFFRPLRSIQRGDMITMSTLQGAYRYRVVFMAVVRPEDIQVLYPTERSSLTLVTCFPFAYVGSAPQRFIVRAERTPGI